MCWELRELEGEPGSKLTIEDEIDDNVFAGVNVRRDGGGADATSELGRRRGGEAPKCSSRGARVAG